jgi:uncharacterized protein YndB with AHSA1/START domain
MPRYTTSVPSSLTPQAAFEYMARFEHLVEWDPSATESRSVSGDPDLGARYEVAVRFGKGIQRLTYEITEFDPPRRVVLVADAPRYRSTDTITIAPDGEGSVVTYDAVIDLKGLLKLVGPIVAGRFRAAGDAARDGMRRALNRA